LPESVRSRLALAAQDKLTEVPAATASSPDGADGAVFVVSTPESPDATPCASTSPVPASRIETSE